MSSEGKRPSRRPGRSATYNPAATPAPEVLAKLPRLEGNPCVLPGAGATGHFVGFKPFENHCKGDPMSDPMLEQDAILEEIVHRLVDAFAPERIYLFGSKARGDAGVDSDYDIMVVVASSPDPPHRRSQQGYLALREIGAAVDVVVWTREAFDGRLHLKASFPSTVVREGKLLYAA